MDGLKGARRDRGVLGKNVKNLGKRKKSKGLCYNEEMEIRKSEE